MLRYIPYFSTPQLESNKGTNNIELINVRTSCKKPYKVLLNVRVSIVLFPENDNERCPFI